MWSPAVRAPGARGGAAPPGTSPAVSERAYSTLSRERLQPPLQRASKPLSGRERGPTLPSFRIAVVVTTAMRKLERSLRSATGQSPAWMGCGRAAPRMQAQAAALLVSLLVRGCSGDEPYVGEHRTGLGKFLAALRDEMPLYDDRVKMVSSTCVSPVARLWAHWGPQLMRSFGTRMTCAVRHQVDAKAQIMEMALRRTPIDRCTCADLLAGLAVSVRDGEHAAARGRCVLRSSYLSPPRRGAL